MFTQTLANQFIAVGLIMLWVTAIGCDLVGVIFMLVDLVNDERFVSHRWRVIIFTSLFLLVVVAVYWYSTLPVGGLKQ